ncbi:alpha/beta fold hydrolase [Actinomadura sp. 7K507]|uniref:alpha/beta fold hydrolase n=1 Tax=Actinomadura sp. 7K507 TaxID=2530365 RepID=UPI0014048FB3|nr:alpha/beta fold hydrolase [Actinomadura sp. 7K507]
MLVHGAFHGSACWARTASVLTELGHDARTVELPLTSLSDDADTVRSAIEAANSPVVLVGHSYGGLVISRAADGHAAVRHLVYVAAAMLDGADTSHGRGAQFPATPLRPLIRHLPDGTAAVEPEDAVRCFFNECPPDVAAEAATHLRPTAIACVAEAPGSEPWRTIPSTYVVCERDRAVHPDFQRWMAARAGHVVTLDTDHFPCYSQPRLLAGILASAEPAPEVAPCP